MLLGAGFSHDLGMPIANGITKDFFYFLNEDRVRKYIKRWKYADPYGEGRPIDPNAIGEIISLIDAFKNKDDSNYEDFLKVLQERNKTNSVQQCYRDSYHFLFGKFFDMIYQMFFMYHVHYLPYYMINRQVYRSLADFIGDEELWVMTLNHDLIIEFLCMDNKIPICFGSKRKVSFPISNKEFEKTIEFEAINRQDLKISSMNFISGEKGINIIKLHGALNEFSYNDDKEILHLSIDSNDNPELYLSKTSQVLHEMKYYIGDNEANICSEIAISDMNGSMQFLRKSVLTGGYKYSKTFDPKPGEEKMELMRQVIDNLDELIIIGYGFCDRHINLRLYNAMLQNKELKITIVDPFRNNVPEILEPFDYRQRVRRVTSFTPEWLWFSTKNNWDLENSKELRTTREMRSEYDRKYRERHLGSNKERI